MTKLWNPWSLCLSLVLGWCGFSSSAVQASDPPVGPIYFANATDTEIIITELKYTDSEGDLVAVQGAWRIKPKSGGYLLSDKNKIRTSKFTFHVKTTEGTSTGWSHTAKSLDKDGDVFATFSPANLTVHYKDLGITPPNAAPAKPAVNPAEIQAAQREVSRLESKLNAAREDVLKARLAEAAAIAVYNNTEAGSGAEFLAAIALTAARTKLSEYLSYENGVQSELNAARAKLNALQYSR